MQALQSMPPSQQFTTIADLAGFPAICGDARRARGQGRGAWPIGEATKLVQMNRDAMSTYQYPGHAGFLINGEPVDKTATWEPLEPKIKEALGS